MADQYREGQTATNPKTGVTVRYTNGQWVNAPAAPGAPVAHAKMDSTTEKELNTLNNSADTAREVKQRIQSVLPAAQRLGTGPWKGAFLSAAIPDQGGGILDKVGAALIGIPARAVGAISDQDVEDYQTLMRAATLGTRQSETGEKGVQTEGDAARAMLTTVSPSQSNNPAVVAQASAKADRAIARASFYSKWANTYGLNGTNPQGQSVQDAFNATLGGNAGPKVTIRRIK